MLGLGLSIVGGSAVEASSQVNRNAPALTAWTETAVGSATTPAISVGGNARASIISLVIDAAADWSGNLGDYSLVNASVINLGTSSGLTGQTYTFSTDLGTVAGGRFIATAPQAFNNSPVSAGPGQTIRITADLTRSGYEVKSITVDHTY
tara:strand:- start:193 stop:642 length:450 start_codon:yes stop_codon:yes gene_type:complete